MKTKVKLLNCILLTFTLLIGYKISLSLYDDTKYCLIPLNPITLIMDNLTSFIAKAFGNELGKFYTECINSYIFNLGVLSFIAVNMNDTKLILLGIL
jgi:hypothetical protein